MSDLHKVFNIGDRCVYLDLAGRLLPAVVIGIDTDKLEKYRIKIIHGSEISAEAATKDLGWSRIFTKDLLKELNAKDKLGNTGLEDHYWERITAHVLFVSSGSEP